MNQAGLLRLALGAAAPMLLGGCVAALVPVIAGGAIAKETLERKAEKAAAAPAAQPVPQASAPEPSRAEPVSPELPPSAELPPASGGGVTDRAVIDARVAAAVAGLGLPAAKPVAEPAPARPARRQKSRRAAPAPVPVALPVSTEDRYADFARFALATAMIPAEGARRMSAVIDQQSLTLSAPVLSPCGSQPPAVLLDLDPGDTPFDLANPPLAANGLAQHLTDLRQAGVTILWAASLPVSDAEALYIVLQASGLDPQRTDRLLLLRTAGERKQERRLAASREWCILAMAGDRRADFDEVFDYLRDPDGPIGRALEPNVGSRWFIAPPPID